MKWTEEIQNYFGLDLAPGIHAEVNKTCSEGWRVRVLGVDDGRRFSSRKAAMAFAENKLASLLNTASAALADHPDPSAAEGNNRTERKICDT